MDFGAGVFGKYAGVGSIALFGVQTGRRSGRCTLQQVLSGNAGEKTLLPKLVTRICSQIEPKVSVPTQDKKRRNVAGK